MTRLHDYDVLHNSRIQGAGLFTHLDELADANRGSNFMHLLLSHTISQHKHIAREKGGGPYLDLPLADGFLWKHRTIAHHALLLEVRYRQSLLLWLGLHHPPGLIPGFF